MGALGAAVTAATLLAACPVDPSVLPEGKSCLDPTDPCPAGWDCFQRACALACTAGQQCDRAKVLNQSVIAPRRACHCNADCGCPQICNSDPWWAARGFFGICEDPCPGGTSDCADPASVCAAGACVVDVCGKADAGLRSSRIDGPCAAQGLADGTCLPLIDHDAGASAKVGVCLQGAAAPQGPCSTSATRATPDQLCPPGQVCYQQPTDPGPLCYLTCDYYGQQTSVCSSNGLTCVPTQPGFGICHDGG